MELDIVKKQYNQGNCIFVVVVVVVVVNVVVLLIL